MLWLRKTSYQLLFQIWYVLNKHLCLLDFVDVDKTDAEVEYVEFVEEAELHNARGCIDVALRVQVLSSDPLKVLAAHLQLEVLHVVVDHFRPDGLQFVHGVLLMLRLNRHCTGLNHEAEMVECDANDKHGHIVSDRASFEQVYREEERVVIFRGV